MRATAVFRAGIASAAVAVVCLSGCSGTSSEPSATCSTSAASPYSSAELSDRLAAVHAYGRPGFVGLDGTFRTVNLYWYGRVPDDVAIELAHARACGVDVSLRPASHSTAELSALRHRIMVIDRPAWARYGFVVLETSNRRDGSGVLVVVPDAVRLTEAQSFAASRYSIPVFVIPEIEAGL